MGTLAFITGAIRRVASLRRRAGVVAARCAGSAPLPSERRLERSSPLFQRIPCIVAGTGRPSELDRTLAVLARGNSRKRCRHDPMGWRKRWAADLVRAREASGPQTLKLFDKLK